MQWCLEQLEQLHARKSVSDMATVKFRQMLNRELSTFSGKGTSGGGNQVTNYIVSTFLDQSNDMDGTSADEGISSAASSVTPITAQVAATARPSVSLVSNSIARFGVHFESEAQMAQLEELLPTLETWGPDMFAISKAAVNRPLTATAYYIFKVGFFFTTLF